MNNISNNLSDSFVSSIKSHYYNNDRLECMKNLYSNNLINNNNKFYNCKEDNKCAANVEYDKINGTCFSLESLIKISNSFNKHNISNKIIIDINDKDLKKKLIIQLRDRLKNKCNDQICWLGLDFIKKLNDDTIDKYTFRPKLTNNRFDWLSNINIDEFLKQYELKHKNFKSFGAVSYDYDDYPFYELYNLVHDEKYLDKLIKNGKNKLGIVYNLDKLGMGGSHWVSLYSDLKNKKIYFFDSVGNKPGARIKLTINKIKKWLGNDCEIKINKTEHQKKNSECGIYSIYFIIKSLEDENIDKL
jgi:hypothetical protein